MNRTVLLVDGTNLAHRAYHALGGSGAASADQIATLAKAMIVDWPKRLHMPHDYIVAVFDAGDSGRKAIYPDYKGNRPQRTDELGAAMDMLFGNLSEVGAWPLMLGGYEADDVIATYAAIHKEEGGCALVMSSDSDLLQLVAPRVQVALLGRRMQGTQVYTPEMFERQWGFPAPRLADYKALVGESGDNIPGVPGIGDKTARKLLADFGSIHALYQHLHGAGEYRVTDRMRGLLLAHGERVWLNLQLTMLQRDVPGVPVLCYD